MLENKQNQSITGYFYTVQLNNNKTKNTNSVNILKRTDVKEQER